MISKKLINNKKKLTKKNKIIIKNSIKYYFTKKLNEELKKLKKNKSKKKNKAKKYNKSKNNKKIKKKFYQSGGDPTADAGIGVSSASAALYIMPTVGKSLAGNVGKFLQYAGPKVGSEDMEKFGEKMAKKFATRTLRSASEMVADEGGVLLGEKLGKMAASAVAPCVSETPSWKATLTNIGCSLMEGVAMDMVENGVNGEASGSTPQQNLDLHSAASNS